jgi:hypothetical protein
MQTSLLSLKLLEALFLDQIQTAKICLVLLVLGCLIVMQ